MVGRVGRVVEREGNWWWKGGEREKRGVVVAHEIHVKYFIEWQSC